MKVNIFKTKTPPMTTIGGRNMEATSDYSVRKNIDTREGTITKTPVNSYDIVNKQFVDTTALNFVINGGGSAITTGVKGDVMIPFNCTVQSYSLLCNTSGAMVIDIWKDSYANFPPTDADAMPGAGKEPTITSGANFMSQDLSITDWTSNSITAGDVLRFNVDSNGNAISGATLVLNLKRT